MSDDIHTYDCPAEAHLHTVHSPVFLRPGLSAIVMDGRPVGVIFDADVVGPRLCDLLTRHGLADIPHTLQTWPAPTGPAVHLPIPYSPQGGATS